MIVCVALFRGINVGGHRKVAMKDLKAMHEALGLKNVIPYIQSGNIIFTCDDAEVTNVQSRIEDGFEKQFGFHAEVIIRTAAELGEVIENTPFRDQPAKEPERIVVMFLTSHVAANVQQELLKAYNGPEEIFLLGKDMYIYYPDSIGRSKLSGSWLEKKLSTSGTARNWNTVLKVQEIIQSYSISPEA